MMLRVGQGYDRHRLVSGRRLILGGVEIDHDRGLEGHSDADVLSHAIADALLGAAALGDLGTHFSDRDPAQKGRNSLEFLEAVAAMVWDAGYSILNIDATVVAEAPRLAPHVDTMRARMAAALEVDPQLLSVKATRGEGVGPEGRQEAITALAVVLIGPREG